MPARRRQRSGHDAVYPAGAVDEHRELIAASLCGGKVAIAGAIAQRHRVYFVPFCRARVARLRQDDGNRLTGDEFRFVQRLSGFSLDDLRASLVAISLSVLENLLLDQRLQSGRAFQGFLEQVPFAGELVLLAADFHFLELGEVSQSQIQDCLSLQIAKFESFHEDRFRLVLFTDNRDDLVDVEVGNQQAVQDMQTVIDDLQPMTETILDRLFSEFQPLGKQLDEVEHPRFSVEADDIHIDARGSLQ